MSADAGDDDYSTGPRSADPVEVMERAGEQDGVGRVVMELEVTGVGEAWNVLSQNLERFIHYLPQECCD